MYSIGSHIRPLFGPIDKKVWPKVSLCQSGEGSNNEQNHSLLDLVRIKNRQHHNNSLTLYTLMCMYNQHHGGREVTYTQHLLQVRRPCLTPKKIYRSVVYGEPPNTTYI